MTEQEHETRKLHDVMASGDKLATAEPERVSADAAMAEARRVYDAATAEAERVYVAATAEVWSVYVAAWLVHRRPQP